MRYGKAAFGLVLVLGLGLRGYHFGRNPDIWHDEAALLLNVESKSWSDLLGPLYFAEAAPPVFLWLTRLVYLIFGDHPYALRLLPFLASCVTSVGLLLVVRRVLPVQVCLWFGLLLACSDRLLWHACEAKPYALDAGVMALAIILVARRRESWSWRDLGLWAVLSPVLVGLSFPACFVVGGTWLALTPQMWRTRKLSTWLAHSVWAGLLLSAFGLLFLGPIQAQHVPTLAHEWEPFFPNWQQPLWQPLVLLGRWTEVARYACEPIGNALVPFALWGGWALWRQGQRTLLAVLVWPLLLVSIAWLLGRYPLGPSRVTTFLAPALLLLMAIGLNEAWSWLVAEHRWALPLLAIVGLVPVVQAGYRCVAPWERAALGEALALLRERARADEVVIGTTWEHGYYLRPRGIYYRPLVRETQPPPGLPPVAEQLTAVGSRYWLLLRRTPTEREQQCWAALRQQAGWRLVEQHEFTRLTVFYMVHDDSANDSRP